MRNWLIVAGVYALVVAGTAQAAKPTEMGTPAQVQKLMDCRAIAEPDQRLACYDREAGAMSSALASKDLIVIDKEKARATRRSLFGLVLPDLGIFGDDESEESGTLETTIKTASQNAQGKWFFELAEGGSWQQLDSREFIIDPAPGQPIRIRRAAFGSYLANVNKQIAVRVRRIN